MVGKAAIQELKNCLRGNLLRPGDGTYDEARKIYNAMIDKRPALIARCAGAADVIRCVNLAREHQLVLSVRGGGHNVAGKAVCDDGLMIDLSRMKGVRVNPGRGTVHAEPGLTWGELNDDLQLFGLAATGGFVSTTGVAGLTLGGGLGWLVRKHGLALDNLLSVDLVTADGKLLKASARENADLFWGLRGGGGNFGIVTSFEFQIHPVGLALAGIVIHPIERAKEVLQLFRQHVHSAPDELTWGALLFSVPPSPEFPPPMHGVPVIALAVCYAGPLDDGGRVL